MDGEESLGKMQLFAAGGTPDSVVADFDTTAWQHVLDETFDKLQRRKGDVANLLGSIVTVAKTDFSVFERLQAAVGDRDTKDVAAQILEDLFTAPGRLTVNDPFFLPQRGRQTAE